MTLKGGNVHSCRDYFTGRQARCTQEDSRHGCSRLEIANGMSEYDM